MKRITMCLVALSLIALSGCAPKGVDYTTTCDILKVDGKVNVVNVNLPKMKNGQNTITITSREEAQQLIDALESLKIDLEMARDQMPVQEPPQPPPE